MIGLDTFGNSETDNIVRSDSNQSHKGPEQSGLACRYETTEEYVARGGAIRTVPMKVLKRDLTPQKETAETRICRSVAVYWLSGIGSRSTKGGKKVTKAQSDRKK